jgi:hypothetical protein
MTLCRTKPVSSSDSRTVFFSGGGTYVTRYCGHFWPIVQPQMIDEGDCGVIGGMKIGRGNRCTRRKPAPAPFCPPQILLDQARARTRAAAVGSQRLTAQDWVTLMCVTYLLIAKLQMQQHISEGDETTPDINATMYLTRSPVGIATGYELDNCGVGVRVPVGSRIFSSPRHPDRL